MLHNNRINSVMAVMALAVAAVAFLISCSDDCPSCPGDTSRPVYKGYVYVGDNAGKIYQIDTETDSLIDSIAGPGIPGYMNVSQDGRYLGIFHTHASPPQTIIYDAQTLEPLKYLDTPVACLFVSSENLMIGYRYGSLNFFSLPDFSLIGTDSIDYFSEPLMDEERGLFYAVGNKHPTNSDSTFFLAYDYRNRQIVNTWYLEAGNDQWVMLKQFDLSDSGDKIYFDCSSDITVAAVYCYDLNTREILWIFGKTNPAGNVKLSPDGKEVYAADPTWGQGGPESGAVYFIDAETGACLHGISLFGFRDKPMYHLGPRYLDVTPTGDKLYVSTGDATQGPGTVVVIDVETREITKLIWPELDHYCAKIIIGPKL